MTTIIPNVYTKEKFILESIARINRKNASSLSITTIYTRNGTALITSWEEFVCKIEMISLINGVIQRRKGGKKEKKQLFHRWKPACRGCWTLVRAGSRYVTRRPESGQLKNSYPRY